LDLSYRKGGDSNFDPILVNFDHDHFLVRIDFLSQINKQGLDMKIRLISDTHFDFYHKFSDFDLIVNISEKSKTDEILILAGDICEWRNSGIFFDFLNWASEQFYHVLYVVGNHEFYGSDYNWVISGAKDAFSFIENATFLNLEENTSQGFIDLLGFRFIGSCFWTDFNNNNPMVKTNSFQNMNDYRMIHVNKERITPEFLFEKNQISKKRMISLISDSDLPVIVITHHAPHEYSRDHRYDFDDLTYSFINTGLVDLILDTNGKIKYWCHGHLHSGKNYLIGETRVISNPLGYPNRAGIPYENPSFNPNFMIECD
jgi:predicted MPP superfamily phosphohydrolase